MCRKFCDVAEVVARIDERLPDRFLVRERRDRLGLRKQSHDVEVAHRSHPLVVRRERRDHRREDRHRMRRRREALEELLHVLVNEGVIREVFLELLQLRDVRQLAVDEQVADLHEARLCRDLLDRIAAVAEDPLLAVDEGDAALARAGVREPAVNRDRASRGTKLRDVDPDLVLRSNDEGQVVRLSVESQFCILFHIHLLSRRPSLAERSRQILRSIIVPDRSPASYFYHSGTVTLDTNGYNTTNTGSRP